MFICASVIRHTRPEKKKKFSRMALTPYEFCMNKTTVCPHFSPASLWGGNVAQLIERLTGTPLTQVRFSGAARDFSLGANSLSYGVCTPPPSPRAIACINICVCIKDLVVHVTLWKHLNTKQAPLGGSWLSPGKTTRISHGRNPIETIQL